ncbi:ATP-dependent helicase, partial [Roseateles sp. GG27B]
LSAEAEARDQLWGLGLLPLDDKALQWRSPPPAGEHAQWWTLLQEEFFGAFWLEQVPDLQAKGWAIVVCPGFAHRPVAAEAWKLSIQKLGLPAREGSWLLSLGVEIEGESLDLAPMIADLLRRDARWLKAEEIALIDDDAVVLLHAPGGRRIEAPAATLKAILGAMIDLLTDPKRAEGPLRLNDWDASRLLGLDDQAGWQIHGDDGLRQMAH